MSTKVITSLSPGSKRSSNISAVPKTPQNPCWMGDDCRGLYSVHFHDRKPFRSNPAMEHVNLIGIAYQPTCNGSKQPVLAWAVFKTPVGWLWCDMMWGYTVQHICGFSQSINGKSVLNQLTSGCAGDGHLRFGWTFSCAWLHLQKRPPQRKWMKTTWCPG